MNGVDDHLQQERFFFMESVSRSEKISLLESECPAFFYGQSTECQDLKVLKPLRIHIRRSGPSGRGDQDRRSGGDRRGKK